MLLGIPIDADGHIDIEVAAAAAGISKDEDGGAWESLPPHRDEEQVQLDVNRAFVYYPTRMYFSFFPHQSCSFAPDPTLN